MMELSDKEKKFINRIARQKKLYLIFSIGSALIAVLLLGYYGLVIKNINSLRFLIVILILLSARAHMRQYRSALIIYKLKLWLDNKENLNEINVK